MPAESRTSKELLFAIRTARPLVKRSIQSLWAEMRLTGTPTLSNVVLAFVLGFVGSWSYEVRKEEVANCAPYLHEQHDSRKADNEAAKSVGHDFFKSRE